MVFLRFIGVLLISCWLPFAVAADEEKPKDDYVGILSLNRLLRILVGRGKRVS